MLSVQHDERDDGGIPSARHALVAMGRYAAHCGWERITRHQAVVESDVPGGPAAVTRDWLTAVLCGPEPGGGCVLDFDWVGGSVGTSSRRALRISYDFSARERGCPERLFAKFTAELRSRLVIGLSGELPGEPTFYNAVRPNINLRAPLGFHGGFDMKSGRSVVLLEDIARSQSASFCSPTTPLTKVQARSLVSTLAALHGQMWAKPATDRRLRHLDSPLIRIRKGAVLLDARKRSSVGVDRAAEELPGAFLDNRDQMWDALIQSLKLCQQGPQTFLHGDAHLGNFYLTSAGSEVGACDWQASTTGHWSFDVGYALTCALPVQDRRNWEEELINHYLHVLGGYIPDVPSFDEAWLAYRQQPFWGLHAWLITLGRSAVMPQMQPDEVSRAELVRVSNAIVDLDSLNALDNISL
jgi:hypothetical protein